MTQRQCDELNTGKTVRDLLNEVALERELRDSTRLQYLRNMTQLGILDEPVSAVTQELVVDRLWTIQNANTRRGALVAARSVLGYKLKIPKAIPRRYTLPDEDTLRLALMTSPHETRALMMMYCALRLGEACAITRADLSGDRLRVDKQVVALRETGRPTVVRITETKTAAADVVVPHWLIPRIEALTTTAKPDGVRESIRRAGDRVGISLNPHQLRHWAATTLLERGAPLVTVSRVLRHSDIKTTAATYIQVDDSAAVHSIFG